MTIGATGAMFDRILPEYSAFLEKATQQHETIEQCLESSDVGGLEQQHSRADAEDPLNIAPFKFEEPSRDQQHVSQLKQEADSGKQVDKQVAADVRDGIQQVADTDEQADLQALASTLTARKELEIGKVVEASASLEEIVSPEPSKRKGREEILRAAYTPEEVDNMHPDAKSKAFKEVRSQRIRDRAQIGRTAAQALHDDSSWTPALERSAQNREDILHRAEDVQRLQDRCNLATTKKDDIATIEKELSKGLKFAQEQLDKCKSHKKKVSKDLDGKRASFKIALQNVRDEHKAYTDLHLEHEGCRIQVKVLSDSVDKTRERLEAVREAMSSAMEACDLWQQSTTEEIQQIEQKIATEANNCVQRGDGLIKEAASSTGLAQELWTRMREENVLETDYLQDQINTNQAKLQRLQEQMTGVEEAEQDMADIEADLAQGQDQKASYNASMDKCASIRAELDAATQVAISRWDLVVQHKERMESTVDMDAIRNSAREVAGGCYTKYPLWKKGITSNPVASCSPAGSEASVSSSNALVTFDKAQMDYIQKMIKEEAKKMAQQIYEQNEAERLFGRPGSAASSDIGDFQVVSSTAASA